MHKDNFYAVQFHPEKSAETGELVLKSFLTTMRIIPAIDIIDGKCVRLVQGDYAKRQIYNENPLDVALSFEDAGLTHLHLVDLDGAKAGKVVSWQVIETVVRGTSLKVDFGGGIKTTDEVQRPIGHWCNPGQSGKHRR
jgi:phosphoribosylformimino-5-aminoimidazole carboxamide ribonucleotide (ProFAR) isomerase